MKPSFVTVLNRSKNYPSETDETSLNSIHTPVYLRTSFSSLKNDTQLILYRVEPDPNINTYPIFDNVKTNIKLRSRYPK